MLDHKDKGLRQVDFPPLGCNSDRPRVNSKASKVMTTIDQLRNQRQSAKRKEETYPPINNQTKCFYAKSTKQLTSCTLRDGRIERTDRCTCRCGKRGEAIFPSLARRKTADMIREDPEAAGLPYQDEIGEFADFHSLRHTSVTKA